MKKIFFLLAVVLFFVLPIMAQSAPKPLKKVLELKMPKTADDDMCGTRGASVVWHPVLKKYYAAFAGNAGYPLGVFDATGKRISTAEQTTLFDIRGLWYNSASKTIQMNGYADNGWAEYKLDSKGIPMEVQLLFEGQNQPDPQSTGTFNAREKAVYFFSSLDGNLYGYPIAIAEEENSITLHLGKTKENDEFENADVLADYNPAAAYTGSPGAEIALLNHYEKKIELYSLRTGYKVKEFSLPENTAAEAIFNFAYSNNIFWLFDISARTWKGFK